MGIYGQDWASYQTSQPDTKGLSFAFVKITEGLGYINAKWRQQRDHAKAAGLVWGGYCYPHMANDPHAEADYFLKQVAWQPGDVIILDWEGYDDANKGVSQAKQLAYKEEWLRYVKAKMPHNPVGMYCNTSYWKSVDTTGYYGDFLWIATGGRPAGDPGIQAPWLFHQYTDRPIDTNYCHLGSIDALRTWAHSFASPADPITPKPAPTEEDDLSTTLPQERSDSWNSMIWGLKNVTETTLARVTAIETLIKLLAADNDLDEAAVAAAVEQAVAKALRENTVNVDVNINSPKAS